jgi:hypothetical protein
MRKPLLLTGLVLLVLMIVASFHVCLHSMDHNDAMIPTITACFAPFLDKQS